MVSRISRDIRIVLTRVQWSPLQATDVRSSRGMRWEKCETWGDGYIEWGMRMRMRQSDPESLRGEQRKKREQRERMRDKVAPYHCAGTVCRIK
jgi:hypothetical protein